MGLKRLRRTPRTGVRSYWVTLGVAGGGDVEDRPRPAGEPRGTGTGTCTGAEGATASLFTNTQQSFKFSSFVKKEEEEGRRA